MEYSEERNQFFEFSIYRPTARNVTSVLITLTKKQGIDIFCYLPTRHSYDETRSEVTSFQNTHIALFLIYGNIMLYIYHRKGRHEISIAFRTPESGVLTQNVNIHHILILGSALQSCLLDRTLQLFINPIFLSTVEASYQINQYINIPTTRLFFRKLPADI